jgi:predicted metal-dependent peptidase
MATPLPQEILELRTAMIVNTPFFAHLMLERGVVEVTDDQGLWRGIPMPTACTDGRHIVFNMDFMRKLTPAERLFVGCHEVFHMISRHSTRARYYRHNGLFGECYDHGIGNIAMDAVINKALRDCAIGMQPKCGVDLTKELASRGYTLLGTEAWEDVYKVLLDWAEENEKKGGKGQGMPEPGEMGGDVFDTDTADGEIPSEAEMKASIKSSMEAAKAAGKMPGGLQSFFDEFLEPQVDWRERLQTAITVMASPDHYDWNRVNRHKIISPGFIMPRMQGTTCGPVAISIDTSLSVSDHELQAFLSEASAILSEVRPEKVTIIWCDAAIDRVDEVDQAEELLELTRAQGVPGRGGTSFIPPFEHIAGMEETPYFHIYMTDGYGPFPTEDQAVCPTIWLINNHQVTPPFGVHIVLDVK